MTSTVGNVASRAARAGGTVIRQVRSALNPASAHPADGREPASGWLVVSLLKDPTDIDTGALPAPLAELGDDIDVRVRPAANGKGAELSARFRHSVPTGSVRSRLSGTDPHADLRSALRRAKQLIEVGEVLAVDPAPHGRRTATPGGTLLESWTKASPKAGVR